MSWFDQLDIGSLLKDSGLNELVEEVDRRIYILLHTVTEQELKMILQLDSTC